MNLPTDIKELIASFVIAENSQEEYQEFLEIINHRCKATPLLQCDDFFIHWTEFKKNDMNLKKFLNMFSNIHQNKYILGNECCEGQGIRIIQNL
jgi:hypothetical protein